MALFKEIYCAHCGKKTGMLTRTRLADGQYVCSQCTSKIPSYIKAALDGYTNEDFRQLKVYLGKTNKQLGQVFHETHTYKDVHLDAIHGLFYVSSIFQERLYLRLADLQSFELQFVGGEAKEGFLSDKVVGDVHLCMQMAFPYFVRNEVLAMHEKASADVKHGLFKKTFVYGQPKGMAEFLGAFNSVWHAAKEEKYRQEAMIWAQNQVETQNGF